MADRNLIIGGYTNYGINELKPWVLSAKEVAEHNTDIVLVYGNTSQETLDWLEEQGAYFHRRSPSAKQNHNIFFATDEQRTMFLLKVTG